MAPIDDGYALRREAEAAEARDLTALRTPDHAACFFSADRRLTLARHRALAHRLRALAFYRRMWRG
ncbi:MAG: hypothetical protein H6702_05405 [Myxococcales bacterium]|nr:hypothetical protein [Myxococcales bacterium]